MRFLSNVIKEMKKVTWLLCSSGLWSASTHYIPFKIIVL